MLLSAHPDDLLRGLDPDQAWAVTHPPGPLAIEAGPGSGKTRVLTRRIAYRVATGTADPARTLVLTFTRKAAWELQERLAALSVDQVWAGTVHSVASHLLHQFWSDHLLPRRPIARNPRRLMAEAVAGLEGAPPVATLLREAEWLGARGLGAADYADLAASRGHRTDGERVAAALDRYEAVKRARGVIDLNDLLVWLARAAAAPATAAALHWRFRHLSVDEAQDLTPAQWLVVRALVGENKDLCLVGDRDQAIYGWNGADPGILTGMADELPETTRLVLRRNYRSLPEVVAAGDRLLGRDDPTPVVRTGTGGVHVQRYSDERDEAEGIVRRIRAEEARGVPLTQMAVLARTNEALGAIESALRAAGVGFQSGRSLLAEPVVGEVLRRLGAVNLRTPARSCLDDVAELTDEVLGDLATKDGAADSVTLRSARERLDQFGALVAEWAASTPSAPLALLPEWLATAVRSRGGDPGEVRHGVELSTFHRAKGLEFRVVFVAGLRDGLVPLASAADLAEERRLLFVALTRAEERLFCSWALQSRPPGGPVGTRVAARPSRFLSLVETISLPATGARSAETAGVANTDVGARVSELRQLVKGA